MRLVKQNGGAVTNIKMHLLKLLEHINIILL